ncbi:MAG: GNAT family N-acetyltransferase [Alphaproteobacteria bacterium]|nr:GNAT family N-acetyltransferase [Alphaproteobacteria bacterium SS10]
MELLQGDGLRLGRLGARLATGPEDVAAVQRLRYEIFYEEMAAKPDEAMAAERKDMDAFDDHADHLMVMDHERNQIVGTYRLMRRELAQKAGQFYSVDEYDIDPLVQQPGDILELGRSCVHAEYRDRPTMQLLWRGLAAYVFHYDIGFMFGCASFPGVDPDEHAMAFSYLHHHHMAPEELRPVAVRDRYVDMNRLPADQIDPKRALNEMPPLIKGYLRLGAKFGDGAVIDPQFHTTDVCVVVKTDTVTSKYYDHYTRRINDEKDADASSASN